MTAASPPLSLPRTLAKYAIFGVILTALLMLVSGRWTWWRAWLYIAITFGIQLLVGASLYRRCPDLLVERSRMQKNTERWDRVLAPIVAGVGPIAMWVVAAWDVRIHWPPPVPIGWSIAAFLVCALASLLTYRAMLENRFFSATVRLQSDRGQVVVDTGPYHRVRHPGYTGAIAFTLATPLALGSWSALIPAALTAAVLALRTALEDRMLQRRLDGYAAYAHRVRYRLIPLIW